MTDFIHRARNSCVALACFALALIPKPALAAPREAAGDGADARPRLIAVPQPADRKLNGEAIFAARCARCHGADARGGGPDAQFFLHPPRDLRSGFLDKYTDEELIARIRLGAPLRLELDPQALRARTRDVSELVAFLPRLPAIDWDRVEPGNEIFLDRCEICHGPFGHPLPGTPLPPGVRRAPRDLSSKEFQRSVSDRELIEIVRHGRAGMPAIPDLRSRGDAQLLVAYVRTLSPGRELYGFYCAGCHGEDGRGAGIATAGEPPKVVFDRAYFARKDPEELRRSVWHMLDAAEPAMPHLARQLSESDAKAVIAFLRRSQPPAGRPTPNPGSRGGESPAAE